MKGIRFYFWGGEREPGRKRQTITARCHGVLPLFFDVIYFCCLPVFMTSLSPKAFPNDGVDDEEERRRRWCDGWREIVGAS